jgi:hypothetical protein
MTTLRYRLVTEQDGKQHVSGTLLRREEIPAMINIEHALHEAGGWTVTRYEGVGLQMEKDGVSRWTWIRARTPLEDTL